VILAIKTAREHGDLSENFEYHAAKNEQGLLEARIRTLRSRLDNSVLVDESEVVHDEVSVGSLVEIGRGRRPAEWLGRVLMSRDRAAAGPTAPSEGLFLVRVEYPSALAAGS